MSKRRTRRAKSKGPDDAWPRGPYKWFQDGRECISVPFTWNLPEVRQYILDGTLLQEKPLVGGPAVKLMPEFLADIAEIGGDLPGVLQRANPLATRTSFGCPRGCGFCAVSRIEGPFRELEDWPDLPIICDSNLLAASRAHFDKVIDRLKHHSDVNFNQGLDARFLTDYHARRLAEVNGIIRFSWDNIADEAAILTAVARLRRVKIPRRNMRCYVLIGFNDTPEDALYRLEVMYFALGILTSPMRYTPLDSLEKNYTGPNWTDKELKRMMTYWSDLRNNSPVPYEEFR